MANKAKKRTQQPLFSTLRRVHSKYYLALIFVMFLTFIGIATVYKYTSTKQTIYVKFKVSQGTWWANTQKPSIWFVKGIEQAQESKDLAGQAVATVLDVVYYPYILSAVTGQAATGQYDIYVTAKLKVTVLGKKGMYNFNRGTIGIGSPIYLEFPNVQFSGTVIALSESPFNERYVKKTVYLTKRAPLPWEYDQIEIGDSQTNGKQTVFEIVDKSYNGEIAGTSALDQGWLINTNINLFTVKANILVKEVNGQYIFGEEEVIAPSRYLIGVSTKKFTFTDYYITMVE
ncbi:MAG: hypothetical protein WAV30_04620 [Microgenomates group bacterium]